MSQAGIVIPNSTGFDFRQNINMALLAIVTQFSGVTEPAISYPGMVWIDTSGGGEGIHRVRNQANSQWLAVTDSDQIARDAAAAAQATADSKVSKAGDTMTGPLTFNVAGGDDVWQTTEGGLTYFFRHYATNTGIFRPHANAGAGDWAWRYLDDDTNPVFFVNGAVRTMGTAAGLMFGDRHPAFDYTYLLYGASGLISFRVDNRDIWSVEAATGLTTFQRRPIFGTATPWDSANFTPLTYPNDATLYLDGSGNWTAPPKVTFPGGTTAFLRADGTWAVPAGTGGGGGTAAWGDISGTLSAQTDLQAALNLKADAANTVTLTTAQTISGQKTFSTTIRASAADILRSTSGRVGLIFRDDGTSFYWLQTALDDPLGPWNTNRALVWNYNANSIGLIGGEYLFEPAAATFNNPLNVVGNVVLSGGGFLRNAGPLGVRLDFGSSALWTLGIQTNRVYFRIPSGGAWNFFTNGTHTDATDDPGAGGTLVAQIGNTGNMVIRDLFARRADGGGAIFFGDQTTGSKYIFYDAANNAWHVDGGASFDFNSANVWANTFIARNPGVPATGAYYFGDQSGGDRNLAWDGTRFAFSGTAFVAGGAFRSLQNFASATQNVVLAAVEGAAGTVFLRPNGFNSAVGELRLDTVGNVSAAGSIFWGGSLISNTQNMIFQTTGAGGMFFRPNNGSDALQMIYDNGGNLAVGAAVYTRHYFQQHENSAANWIRIPRTYVQAADPGAAAGEGDLWIW